MAPRSCPSNGWVRSEACSLEAAAARMKQTTEVIGKMPGTPKQVVEALLKDTTNELALRELCARDLTYVSLNYSNPDLKKVMPWCGTGKGVRAIVDTFRKVSEYWIIDTFNPQFIFGEGEKVAVFGDFTYTSRKLRKQVRTPFAIFCRVEDGKLTYMQFMEDTFCTAASFRSGGVWRFQSDPGGGEVEV